jgi:hypothetical protein
MLTTGSMSEHVSSEDDREGDEMRQRLPHVEQGNESLFTHTCRNPSTTLTEQTNELMFAQTHRDRMTHRNPKKERRIHQTGNFASLHWL